jgi:hypothetical protein
MKGKLITKKVFLESMLCPTKAWYLVRQTTETLSIYDRFIIEEGLEVHNKAHLLFPEGIFITGNNMTAAQQTAKLLNDPSASTLFEATLIIPKGITRTDILKKISSGFHLYEVKSGLDPKEDYIDDLSYTTMICKQAGLPIRKCSLILLSRDYVYGKPVQDLFQEHDCTEEVFQRSGEFWELYDQQAICLLSPTQPPPEFKKECKECEHLKTCFPQLPRYPIFDLPRLHHTKFCQLRDMNINQVKDIPDDFSLTETQGKVRKAVLSGKPYLNKAGLKKKLESLEYPLYFLDFETVITALPLYPDTTPHTQIPTQYSLHVAFENISELQHYEYLSDPKKDCRRTLADKLISHCGNKGTIFTYTSFEKTIINGLADQFPDLAGGLQNLVNRLVDLCQILKTYYYHPDFHGSYSIKNVLPVMVPKLSYTNMEIGNGSEAVAQFAYMAQGKYDSEQEKQIKRHLLEYCKLDTLAMVKVYERLAIMNKGG